MDSPQPERPMRRGQKIPEHAWPSIRTMAEQGVSYPELAAKYDATSHAIRKRASLEKWVTPQRLARGDRGELPATDPASLVATMWRERGDQTREMLYQGTRKSLERFFAMAPIPVSFTEAAAAEKLLSKAINPLGEQQHHNPTTINILASPTFSPTPVTPVRDI